MGFGSKSSPSVPPPTPIPTREDPSVANAQNRQRMADAQRRGRRAAILTPPEDELGAAPVDRATALSGTLGGTKA
jgi:hypothetical protein